MMNVATRLELKLNPEEECRRIEDFIRQAIKDQGKKGATIGLSGGLDSAVAAYLCARALSPQKVLGLIMPERDSNPQNIADARELARELGIETEEIDLTPLLEQIGYSSSLAGRPEEASSEGCIGPSGGGRGSII